jgi:hypothetical protein
VQKSLRNLAYDGICLMGKIHFTPLKYPPICTFAFKVSNVTLYPPPQTFKLWQFNSFGLFIPKILSSHIFFIFKKNPKKKKEKKNAGVAKPPHRWWFGCHLGQMLKRKFERLAQGVAKPPPGPNAQTKI